jgi:hypothetical protein
MSTYTEVDMESDLRHLKDLLSVICHLQFELAPDQTDSRIDSLLWIANDLAKAAYRPYEATPAEPQEGECETISPIMVLFREWETTFAEPGKRPNLTNEEHSQLIDRCGEIEKRMMALPSQGPADVAAKLIAATSFGGFCLGEDSPLIAEAKALVAGRSHEGQKGGAK